MTAPDRLSLIESRWREAGCGDEDKRWLLEEVKRLRGRIDAALSNCAKFRWQEAEDILLSCLHAKEA